MRRVIDIEEVFRAKDIIQTQEAFLAFVDQSKYHVLHGDTEVRWAGKVVPPDEICSVLGLAAALELTGSLVQLLTKYVAPNQVNPNRKITAEVTERKE